MKLIIDISEEEYIRICDEPCTELGLAVRNGIPCSKGHGDLIDRDVLRDYFWDNRSKLYTHKDLQIVIDRQPTIIESYNEIDVKGK